MTELHTQTWLLKRMRQMKAALQECEAYFEERATAEWLEDGPSANREGQLLTEVRDALDGGYWPDGSDAPIRDSDGTRSAETACPAPVPQDCQARCEAIAQPQSPHTPRGTYNG